MTNIVWKPQEVQEKALVSNAFEILFGGARGGGKSETGIVWFLKAVNHKNFRGLVIRKNHDDLKDWLARAARIYIPLGAVFRGNPQEIRWPSGAVIVTGHLKDENAYQKYQGHEYQRILIEELTQIPDLERYLMLLSSCRSTIPGLDARVFCTTNPGGPGHQWVKDRFISPAPPKTKFHDPDTGRTRIFIPARVEDNPALMQADPNYVKFLDGLPEQLRKAWRDGDWDSFVGMFFPEFKLEAHVYNPSDIQIINTWPKFRSIDWGYTSPLACYWHAVGPDYTIYTYREYYYTKKLDNEAAAEISRLSKDEVIDYTVGDPSSFPVDVPVFKYGKVMPVKRFEVWAENGVPITMGNNDRLNGWSRMREYLQLREGQPKWKISNQCVNLIREIGSATFDKKKIEDLDTNCSDHALDACRYGLMQQPKRYIEPVKYNSEYEAAVAHHKRQQTLAQLRGY